MPLFAGVWLRSGGPSREGTASDLLAALHAPFHSVLSAFEDGPLVLVARSNDRPAVVSHAGTIAALSGRLDGDLHAEDVLDAYLGAATSGFESLSGDYALAVFDARRNTLILLRDAVGTQPLYYRVGPDGSFAFASQIKAVLAGAKVSPRPNRAALAQLLINGAGVPRGQTCFADVQAVAPGQALFVTGETVSSAPYSDLRPVAPPLRTFEESAAAFRHSFTQSVTRRLNRHGTTAIFLSGGLDSSAITGVAAKAGDAGQIVAISYGLHDGSTADERRYVDAVVARTGVRSVWLDLLPLDFPDHTDQDVWASEVPIIDDVPGTLSRAATTARDLGARDMLTGAWADQVLFPFPPPLLVDLLRHGRFRELAQYTAALSSWQTDISRQDLRRALFKQVVRGVLPAAAIRRWWPKRGLAAWFDELAAVAPPRNHRPFSHAGAVRHGVTAPAAVTGMETVTKWGWSNGLKTHTPFLDANLIQLLCAVPAEHALHQGVPKALLRKAMSELVPAAVLDRREKGDYTAIVLEQMQRTREPALDRLQGAHTLLKHRIMSRAAADTALAKIAGAREIGTETAALLSAMLATDAWLRVFFESSFEASHASRAAAVAH